MSDKVKKLSILFGVALASAAIIALLSGSNKSYGMSEEDKEALLELKNERSRIELQREEVLLASSQQVKDLEAEMKEIEKKANEVRAKYSPEVIPTAKAEELDGNFIPTEKGGISEFLRVNGATFTKEATDLFEAAGKINKIRPELLVCIAQADSSLGKSLKTSFNIGNVGNTDSNRVVHYGSLEEGINNIGIALNNQYMKGNTMLGQLSQGGRDILGSKFGCSNASSPYKCYATSKFNWNKNTKACLRNILQDDTIEEHWEFRIK